MNDETPVSIPIDGILDLHLFQPCEVKSLLVEYLSECRQRGIWEVRIIHGKGIGVLRETVHAQLRKMEFVRSFALADETQGSWGATIVQLQP